MLLFTLCSLKIIFYFQQFAFYLIHWDCIIHVAIVLLQKNMLAHNYPTKLPISLGKLQGSLKMKGKNTDYSTVLQFVIIFWWYFDQRSLSNNHTNLRLIKIMLTAVTKFKTFAHFSECEAGIRLTELQQNKWWIQELEWFYLNFWVDRSYQKSMGVLVRERRPMYIMLPQTVEEIEL